LTPISTKSFVGWGFAPNPTGRAYSAPTGPLDVFRGLLLKGGEGGERQEGRGETRGEEEDRRDEARREEGREEEEKEKSAPMIRDAFTGRIGH